MQQKLQLHLSFPKINLIFYIILTMRILKIRIIKMSDILHFLINIYLMIEILSLVYM